MDKDRLKNIEQRANNCFLANRSWQLTRVKLSSLFQSRTVLMVETANFSDAFGFVDAVILDTDIKVVDIPNIGNNVLT